LQETCIRIWPLLQRHEDERAMKRSVLLFAVIVCLTIAAPAWACTTKLTGKKASADGSAMV
jgi:hypothetical protein